MTADTCPICGHSCNLVYRKRGDVGPHTANTDPKDCAYCRMDPNTYEPTCDHTDCNAQIAVLVEALAPLVGLLKVSWVHSKMPTGCSRSMRKAEAVLADLPAAARERAEENERLRTALKTGRICGHYDACGGNLHDPRCLMAALAGEKAE